MIRLKKYITLSPCHLVNLSLAILTGASAFATAPQTEPPPPPPPQEMPWPVKLGARSHTVTQAFPLVDRVVLVPDAATYLDELGKWSPTGRWPVLIEDQELAPMFVRRFKPAQLIRRESVQKPAPVFQPTSTDLESIVIHSFGGKPEQHTVREVFAIQKYAPPGVVITSLKDPAWTAAVALAAGHGQPLVWLNDSFGSPNEELNNADAQRLAAAVDALVASQNYSFKSMGDDIDTITICRDLACRARVDLPPGARANPGGPHADGPVAVTDLLGRNADGARYAVVGWIFGDEIRAAYMAMCSLFLPRERITMWNTYPSDPGWSAYRFDQAAAMLTGAGFTVQHTSGAAADERAWVRSLVGGWSTDIVLMNTKGNSDFFDLFSGTAYPPDVPVLNEPVVLHLIHSWSLQYPGPDRLDSVGAQWLRHGAYAAVGSCWEPYLPAFLPPSELSNRLVNFVPFLVAARWWDNQSPLAKAWRVVTIGDPLMLCGPAAQVQQKRVSQPAEYGVNLIERVKELLRQGEKDESGAAFGEAISILNMLGKDDVAAGAWRLAFAKPRSSAAAAAALEPLFRRRDNDEFMKAWDELPMRTPRAQDMLWHLHSIRLGPGNPSFDRDVLIQLQSAIRQPMPQHDLARLAPALSRVFGKVHVQEVIQRELRKNPSGDAKKALRELAEKY